MLLWLLVTIIGIDGSTAIGLSDSGKESTVMMRQEEMMIHSNFKILIIIIMIF